MQGPASHDGMLLAGLPQKLMLPANGASAAAQAGTWSRTQGPAARRDPTLHGHHVVLAIHALGLLGLQDLLLLPLFLQAGRVASDPHQLPVVSGGVQAGRQAMQAAAAGFHIHGLACKAEHTVGCPACLAQLLMCLCQ